MQRNIFLYFQKAEEDFLFIRILNRYKPLNKKHAISIIVHIYIGFMSFKLFIMTLEATYK